MGWFKKKEPKCNIQYTRQGDCDSLILDADCDLDTNDLRDALKESLDIIGGVFLNHLNNLESINKALDELENNTWDKDNINLIRELINER